MSGIQNERDQHLDRLLTFIDAIVAIAITLLVLPLVDLTSDIDDYDSVAAMMRENQADFWAFLLSFAVIARLWFIQHDSVRHALLQDRRVARLLLVWAFTIAFLPFPTALVADAPDDRLTKVLYIGTMVLSTVFLTLLEAHLLRHPELTDGTDESDPVGGAANIVLLLLALAVTLVAPATSYFPLLLLLLGDRAADGWRRLRGRGSRSTPVGE